MSLKTWSRSHAIMIVGLALAGAAGCDDGDPPAQAATSGATGGNGGGGGAGGAGGGGGAGGVVECDQGSHPGMDGACEATLVEWTSGPALAQERDHHMTFVVEVDAGALLYAAGGGVNNATLLDSVELAPIQPDGSLGPWAAGTPLPAVMAGAGVAVVGRTLVVTGGYRLTDTNQPTLSASTEVTTVSPDGTFGPWSVGPELSATRFHHAMAAHGSSVYVLGGLTGNNTDNTPVVERAIVGQDGSVGAWVEVTPLPGKRSHHSVAVHEDALYVTGGLAGNPAANPTSFGDVLRAAILEGGALGEWTHVGDMPVALATHASFVHAGQLYVLAGVEDNSSNTAAVRRATIGPDGMVGPWEDVTPLPAAHAHTHHTPLHEGFVYSVAGALNHNSNPDVFIGRFE